MHYQAAQNLGERTPKPRRASHSASNGPVVDKVGVGLRGRVRMRT